MVGAGCTGRMVQQAPVAGCVAAEHKAAGLALQVAGPPGASELAEHLREQLTSAWALEHVSAQSRDQQSAL